MILCSITEFKYITKISIKFQGIMCMRMCMRWWLMIN